MRRILFLALVLTTNMGNGQSLTFDHEITYTGKSTYDNESANLSLTMLVSTENKNIMAIRQSVEGMNMTYIQDFKNGMIYLISNAMNMRFSINESELFKNLMPASPLQAPSPSDMPNVQVTRNHKMIAGYQTHRLAYQADDAQVQCWVAPDIHVGFFGWTGTDHSRPSGANSQIPHGALLELISSSPEGRVHLKAEQVLKKRTTIDLSKIKFTELPKF